MTTTRTWPSSTSVATVNLPVVAGRPHRPADHLAEELVVARPSRSSRVVQRAPASVVKATVLPSPYVQLARIVLLRSSAGSGEMSDDLDQRVLLDAGQHEAVDRRQRLLDAAEHLVREPDLRAARRSAFS